MLNLRNANRLYSDVEILEKAAKYIVAHGFEGENFLDTIDLLSKLLDYDHDFLKGFMRQAMQDLKKNGSKQGN